MPTRIKDVPESFVVLDKWEIISISVTVQKQYAIRFDEHRYITVEKEFYDVVSIGDNLTRCEILDYVH